MKIQIEIPEKTIAAITEGLQRHVDSVDSELVKAVIKTYVNEYVSPYGWDGLVTYASDYIDFLEESGELEDIKYEISLK